MSDQHRPEESPKKEFRLQIDERDLATGTFDPVEGEGKRKKRKLAPAADRSAGSYYASDPDSREEKRAHKKRNRVKARKNRWIFKLVWLAMVLLIAFTLSSYLIGGANDLFAVGRTEGITEVELPEQVDAESLAKLLYQRGAIKKPEFFRIYADVTVDDEEWELFENGVYQLGTNLDYQDIISRLQGGNTNREEVRITFPEGSNAIEIAALLEENSVCSAEEFLDALNTVDFSNYSVIARMSSDEGKYYRVEGYLFPDTYDFWKGEDVESVIGKMINNFQSKISDATMAQIDASGYSLDEIVTIASIIQGEAANEKDMYLVSAVIHNRLSFGPERGIYLLQCDSTVYYPYRNRSVLPEYDALPYGNYDTYEVQGLPAGAICNPGMDAINAALKPSTEGDAPTYLYFCHDAQGNAYYAATEEQHNYNRQLAGLT